MTTRQYMTFDNFKTMILNEAFGEKTLWPGGVCWAIRFTNKEKTEGVLDYFVIVKNDEENEENEEKIKQAPLEWLKNMKTEMPSSVSAAIKWANQGTSIANEEKIALSGKDAEYYSLYKYPEKLSIINNADPDKAKEKLKDYCANFIGNCNTRAKIYAMGKGDLEKLANKAFASADEETEKVKTYITQMVEKPETFKGHDNKGLRARIRKVSDMKMGEFIEDYADFGVIEAFIAKKIIDMLAKPGRRKEEKAKKKAEKAKVDAEKAKSEEERKQKEADAEFRKQNKPEWLGNNEFKAHTQQPDYMQLSEYIKNFDKWKDFIKIDLTLRSPNKDKEGYRPDYTKHKENIEFKYDFPEEFHYRLAISPIDVSSEDKKFNSIVIPQFVVKFEQAG